MYRMHMLTRSGVFFCVLISLCIGCRNKKPVRNGERLTYFEHTHDVKTRMQVKDGLAEGLYLTYYPSGKTKTEMYCHKGQRHGICKKFYEDGKVKSIEFFKNDKQDSIAQVFDTEGKLKIESHYNRGKLNGKYVAYYPDGKVQQETHYLFGKQNGEQKSYYPNGQVKQVTYAKGGFPGTGFKEYTKDGKLIDQGVKIVVEEVNNLSMKGEFIYRFRLSKPRPKDQVFFGDLVEGKYIGPSRLALRKKEGGYFEHVFLIPKGASLMETITVIAQTKSSSGKDLVLTKELNVALNNFY